MATEQTGKQHTSRFGAKADFIRGQPDSMSAKDIVEAAAKQGLKISVNHVYNLRGATKQRGFGSSGATDRSHDANAARPPARTSPTGVERQLRNAIAEVGLQRAREVFKEIAKVFRGSSCCR